MGIPTDQLETWMSYETAAITSAKDTHTHIRDNLERDGSRLNDRDITFDTLLQGSYANHTIVRGSSDVDILARMQRPYLGDKKNLSESDIERYYNSGISKRKDYSWSDFADDVLEELKDVYRSSSVNRGNKAIEIDSSTLDLTADVVPCQEYRFYKQFTNSGSDDYIEGIVFWAQDGTKIRNYPEQHMENGSSKHNSTNEKFKPTVRMFKNARNRLVDDGYISSKDSVPSYFIECLVWNADDDVIDTSDLQLRYLQVIENLAENDYSDFRHQHDLVNLFGSAATQWSEDNADAFLAALVHLWEDW